MCSFHFVFQKRCPDNNFAALKQSICHRRETLSSETSTPVIWREDEIHPESILTWYENWFASKGMLWPYESCVKYIWHHCNSTQNYFRIMLIQTHIIVELALFWCQAQYLLFESGRVLRWYFLLMKCLHIQQETFKDYKYILQNVIFGGIYFQIGIQNVIFEHQIKKHIFKFHLHGFLH